MTKYVDSDTESESDDEEENTCCDEKECCEETECCNDEPVEYNNNEENKDVVV